MSSLIFLCRYYGSDILFNLVSRYCHNMLTAHTFNFEINADTQYLKFLASAGMRLFHSQSVADLNIHGINLPYLNNLIYYTTIYYHYQ